MKKIFIVIIILGVIISISALLYFLPFKRTYQTKLGYTIDIPLFSKVTEQIDDYEANDDNEKIVITSYHSKNSLDIINDFLKQCEKNVYSDITTFYYYEKDDFTLKLDKVDEGVFQTIELTLYKGNRYKRALEDDEFWDNYKAGPNRISYESDNSGLVNIYQNIYTYNISDVTIVDGAHYYTILDIFRYNHFTPDYFTSHYENIVKINYGEKEATTDYTLYRPSEERMYENTNYSLLICNNKYIFGSDTLEYDESLCK